MVIKTIQQLMLAGPEGSLFLLMIARILKVFQAVFQVTFAQTSSTESVLHL